MVKLIMLQLFVLFFLPLHNVLVHSLSVFGVVTEQRTVPQKKHTARSVSLLRCSSMALSDWSVRSSALVALAGLDLVNRVALLAPPSDRVLWSSLARKSWICSARPFQVESEALIRTSPNPNACLSVEVQD